MLRVDQPDDLISFRHEAMATDFFAYLGGHEQSYLKQAAYEAFQVIDDIEGKLSLYQESSDVSRVNLAKNGESVPVSHEFIECIQLAARASEATSGRFNAFMGKSALAAKGQTLTHFSAEPTPAQSDQPSIQVDAKNRAVQKLTEGSLLDFGGIGKGYALDKARETLDEWEVETGLLSASGSTLVFLKSPNPPWTAAIGETQIEIPDFTALSSSGLGFQEKHIINPDTQISHSLWNRSYAAAASGSLADAFSTAAFISDKDQLSELAYRQAGASLSVETHESQYLSFGDGCLSKLGGRK